MTSPFQFFVDSNGDPLSGGKIFTFSAGTTTPKASYTTSVGDVENTNPVILDAAGRAVIFIEGSYKYVIKDALDNIIETVDNVTSFNTIAAGENSYFESFSGTGSQTSYTLSTDLGSDENAIMVFVDQGLQEYVTNGGFTSDADWTKGTGWTISGDKANATTATSDLEQTSALTLVEGQAYSVTYTMTQSVGDVTIKIGGNSGTTQTTAGTYTETIIAGDSQLIEFTGDGFTGTIDNVTVLNASSKGFDIQNPNAYTLNGTALVFTTAPNTGANNILVFAPSTLVGAASASADASANSATQSASSADKSEEWATLITGLVNAIDYSSKAYAIGGVGTETNNSKYYSVQSGLSATASDNSATASSGFADNSSDSADEAAASAIQVEDAKLIWRGAYNAGTAYAINDAVTDNGSSFINIQAGTGQTPVVGGTAYWDDLANKGDAGLSGAQLNVANEWTKAQNFDATTLSDAATIAWDLEDNQESAVTLTANRTLGAPTNQVDGGVYQLLIISAGFDLAYNAVYNFPKQTAPTLVGRGILSCRSDGTNMDCVYLEDMG